MSSHIFKIFGGFRPIKSGSDISGGDSNAVEGKWEVGAEDEVDDDDAVVDGSGSRNCSISSVETTALSTYGKRVE